MPKDQIDRLIGEIKELCTLLDSGANALSSLLSSIRRTDMLDKDAQKVVNARKVLIKIRKYRKG